jgi:hypothetical protein
LRLSLYRFDASTLAGELVLGSLSKLFRHVSLVDEYIALSDTPLDAGQDGGDIVCGTPAVLQNV